MISLAIGIIPKHSFDPPWPVLLGDEGLSPANAVETRWVRIYGSLGSFDFRWVYCCKMGLLLASKLNSDA